MEWHSQFADGELAALISDAETAPPEQAAMALETLQECPSITTASEFYSRAYAHLSTCRPIAHSGLAPIPFDSMIRYADEYNFEGEDRETLFRIITALDQHESKTVNERLKKAQAKASRR